MALRVLLADESSTIKKVIQLSLHDFGVEIKAVANGLDVHGIVQSFKPDLVFVDVLLSKKVGYEVISEIKNHPDTSSIPVVLMWSGFMQLDEAKASECRADARLEKPFDSEQLRSIVQDLVAKTKTNPVSNFLVFPQMPQFQENPPARPNANDAGPQNSFEQKIREKSQQMNESAADQNESWSQQSFHAKRAPEENDFGMHHLSAAPLPIPEPTPLAPRTTAPEQVKPAAPAPTMPTAPAKNQHHDEFEEISFDDLDLPKAPSPQPQAAEVTITAAPTPDRTSNVNAQMVRQPHAAAADSHAAIHLAAAQLAAAQLPQMEAIFREEVRRVLQEMCQKVLPDIAEKIVKDEIQKILSAPTSPPVSSQTNPKD